MDGLKTLLDALLEGTSELEMQSNVFFEEPRLFNYNCVGETQIAIPIRS